MTVMDKGREPEVVWLSHQKSANDKRRERLERMAQVAESYASVITLRKIECQVIAKGGTTAISTSKSILFAENHIGELTDPRELMAIKGYTLHEICHILFSPRSATTYRRTINDEQLYNAYAIAEDSRIETLLVGRFGSMITAWLNASVFRHLLTPDLDMARQYPVVAGRKYLPIQVRQQLRDLYFDQANAQRIHDLIDEYRFMVFDNDETVLRALDILRELNTLLPLIVETPGGHETRSEQEHEASGSRPLPYREQHGASERAKKRNEPNDKGTDQVAPPEQNPDDEPGKDNTCTWELPGGDGEPGGDGDQVGDGGTPGTDGDQKGDQSGGSGSNGHNPDEPGKPLPDGSQGSPESNCDKCGKPESEHKAAKTAGKGKTLMTPALAETIDEQFQADLEKVGTEVAKDIRAISQDPELETTNEKTPPKARRAVLQTVDQRTLLAGRQFALELERIRAECEPNWQRKTPDGKINAARYLRDCELDEAFDKWQDGNQEATEIEAVILLDNSGSMEGIPAVHAYKSMFAIKLGLQAIQAPCSVITYNSTSETLYEADEQVKFQVKDNSAGGGTEPLSAIKYAQRVFAESKRAVKVLFVITDGDWGNSQTCDEHLSKLSAGGVITALALLGDSAGNKTHNCQLTSRIQSANDLTGLAKEIVKLAIKKQLSIA